MMNEVLQNVLGQLRAERARLDKAIESIEGVIQAGGGAPVVAAKRRGRPPKTGAAAPAKAGGKGAKAPRGLLRKRIREILAAAGKPLNPTELRDRVIKSGYPVKNKKNLYGQVFVAAKGDAAVKKTDAGFSLKAAAGAKEPKKPGK